MNRSTATFLLTFSSRPMTTISVFKLFKFAISSLEGEVDVWRLGKHLVTVITILEEMMKAEQVTRPEMVTLASHGQISPVLSRDTSSASWRPLFSAFAALRVLRLLFFLLLFLSFLRFFFVFLPFFLLTTDGSSLGLLFFLSPQAMIKSRK